MTTGEGANFDLHGEYRELRPFVEGIKRAREAASQMAAKDGAAPAEANSAMDAAVPMQGDVTRVLTFQLARETSTRAYPEIGAPEGHHPLTHNGGNPEMLAKVAKINAFHVSLFSYYLQKLKATPDGDGSLLDHSLILYGSGMSNGDKHDHVNLPILVAGGKGGRHIRYEKPTPLANVHLTLLDRAGVKVDHFADSKGKVVELL